MMLRASVVANAFVQQMEDESTKLRAAKQALETALAGGSDLGDVTKQLDAANEEYKKNSTQVRKHTMVPKATSKAKAKAKANPA